MSALSNRLASLENARPAKPLRSITCMPFDQGLHGHGDLVADGVYRVQDRYRAGDWQVAYSDRAALNQWLELPEQSDRLRVIYQIVTAESIAATLARIESEI